MSHPTATLEGKRSLSDAHRWSIVGLLCLAFFIAYFDRQNLSIALTVQEFKDFFRLSDNDRGLLNSAFFLSYTLMQLPAGWFVDRYGVKKPFAICFVLWCVVSGLTAFAATLAQLFTLRLLLGIGESAITPAGIRWIRLNFPQKQHGFVMGIYQAAAKIGPAIGAPLIAFLIAAYGWREMFLIIGFGALVWLVPWLILVRDDDRDIERSKESEGPAIAFSQLLSSRAMWGIIAGTFCYQYFNYFCLTWLPSYFAESRGMDLTKNGLFTGFSYLGFGTVAVLGGWAADRLIQRGYDVLKVRKAFIYAGFLLASTELIGAFSPSNDVAVFFAIFSLSGLGLITGNYWALTPAMFPGAPAGRLAALQNMAANVPGIVAPILTGWLKQVTGGYTAPMIAIFVFLLVGIGSYFFFVRREYARFER